MKLTVRQRSELTELSRKPGLWSGVEPYLSDADLKYYLDSGLARHLGYRKGYMITPAGRKALATSNGGER